MRKLAVLVTLAVLVACGGGSKGGSAKSGGSTPPAPAKSSGFQMEWELLSANMQGGTNNGFALMCDDPAANVKTLTFTLRSSDGKTSTATVPCPKGTNRGLVTLAVPGPAPLDVKAVADGKAESASEHVKDFTTQDVVHVRIYGGGCDSDKCQ